MMDPQLAIAFDQRPALDLGSLCSEAEVAVARALRWGRAEARQIAELAAVTGISERDVQHVVQHLLMDHHWPIGTAMSEPHGNYLIDRLEELEHTVALLRTRGLTSLARAAALKRMTLAQYIRLVQCDLETERN